MSNLQRGARLVDHDLSAIHLHNFHDRATLPDPPEKWNLAPAGPADDLLDNGVLGCCVAVAIVVLRMFGAWKGTLTAGVPDYEEGFKRAHGAYVRWLYYKIGIAEGGTPPRPDNGLDPIFALQWLHKHGMIENFAALDRSQPMFNTYAQQVAVEFDGLMASLALDPDAEQEFSDNECWGAQSSTPDPSEGHETVYCTFDNTVSPPANSLWTWGKAQCTTEPFDDNGCVQQLIAVFSNQQAKQAGVDAAALNAAIVAMPGYDQIPLSDLSDAPAIDAPDSLVHDIEATVHEIEMMVRKAVENVGVAEVEAVLKAALTPLLVGLV